MIVRSAGSKVLALPHSSLSTKYLLIYLLITKAGKEIADNDLKVNYGAYIAMYTAQKNVVPWLASQTDMLSEDWEVIE